MDNLDLKNYFTTPVYMVEKPEYLDVVKAVSDRYLTQAKEAFGDSMTTMTAGYSHEPELAEFGQYVSQTAWNILASQGYDMEQLATYFTEMWTHEHKTLSGMETHVHGRGAQVSAFYFLRTPENGCRLVIHDPRPGKVIINLPEKDASQISAASGQVAFTPKEGMLLFVNSWVPHSLLRNISEHPCQLVHMNLSVTMLPKPEVEVL